MLYKLPNKLLSAGPICARDIFIYVFITNSLLFRHIPAKKLPIIAVSPRNVKEPYGRLSGKLDPYLAMTNVSRCR